MGEAEFNDCQNIGIKEEMTKVMKILLYIESLGYILSDFDKGCIFGILQRNKINKVFLLISYCFYAVAYFLSKDQIN